MLLFVAIMVTLTGTIFKRISNFAQNRIEIYTIYPALINMVSSVGSVVGSTANTKLALAYLHHLSPQLRITQKTLQPRGRPHY